VCGAQANNQPPRSNNTKETQRRDQGALVGFVELVFGFTTQQSEGELGTRSADLVFHHVDKYQVYLKYLV